MKSVGTATYILQQGYLVLNRGTGFSIRFIKTN